MPEDPLSAFLERLDHNGLNLVEAAYLHETLGVTEAELRNPYGGAHGGEVPWSWITALIKCRIDVLHLSLAELKHRRPFRWIDEVRFASETAELRAWQRRGFDESFFAKAPKQRESSLRRRFFDYQLRTKKRLVRRGFNGYLNPRAAYAADLRERATRIEQGEPEFLPSTPEKWGEIRANVKPTLGQSDEWIELERSAARQPCASCGRHNPDALRSDTCTSCRNERRRQDLIEFRNAH